MYRGQLFAKPRWQHFLLPHKSAYSAFAALLSLFWLFTEFMELVSLHFLLMSITF